MHQVDREWNSKRIRLQEQQLAMSTARAEIRIGHFKASQISQVVLSLCLFLHSGTDGSYFLQLHTTASHLVLPVSLTVCRNHTSSSPQLRHQARALYQCFLFLTVVLSLDYQYPCLSLSSSTFLLTLWVGVCRTATVELQGKWSNACKL